MAGSRGRTSQGHRTLAQLTINPWHDASQHCEGAANRNRGFTIERKRTSPLTDHLSSPWLARVDAWRIGARRDRCLYYRSALIQFDDSRFITRLPRCDFHLVEELPLHGIVSTQSVFLAVPNVLRQLANSIGGKGQGQGDCLSSGKIGRPDDGEAIRVLPVLSLRNPRVDLPPTRRQPCHAPDRPTAPCASPRVWAAMRALPIA